LSDPVEFGGSRKTFALHQICKNFKIFNVHLKEDYKVS
jgi:hypothetical protein